MRTNHSEQALSFGRWKRRDKPPIKRLGSATVISVVVLCAACVLAVSANHRRALADPSGGKTPAVAATIQPPITAAPQLGAIDENTESEMVMLQPYGFEPAVLHRKPGQFLLVIKNHSGVVAGVALSLRDATARRLQQTTLPLQRPSWYSLVNLQAGTYTLVADNHPDWACTIVVDQ